MAATISEPALRPARTGDTRAVAELLYTSSGELYDRYAGSRERALALIETAAQRPGNPASMEVLTVAELEGGPAGVIAAFPVGESLRRARSFLRLTFRELPPQAWPGALRIYRLGSRTVPPPPSDCFYVDAIATAASARRRGVATALLAHAEARGRALGLAALALETEVGNTGAQALYERFGFEERHRGRPAGPMPGFVSYVKPLR